MHSETPYDKIKDLFNLIVRMATSFHDVVLKRPNSPVKGSSPSFAVIAKKRDRTPPPELG